MKTLRPTAEDAITIYRDQAQLIKATKDDPLNETYWDDLEFVNTAFQDMLEKLTDKEYRKYITMRAAIIKAGQS